MKSKTRIPSTHKDGGNSTLLSSDFCATPEFERLSEWVRLGASHVRNNAACVEEHRHSLRVLGETEDRLNELDHWKESSAFTKQEKAALNLSQAISLNEAEEQSIQIIKDAGCHFNTHQIVRLALVIMAVNEWIDFQTLRL
jgi:AhpD family alkylhydroperoxidase